MAAVAFRASAHITDGLCDSVGGVVASTTEEAVSVYGARLHVDLPRRGRISSPTLLVLLFSCWLLLQWPLPPPPLPLLQWPLLPLLLVLLVPLFIFMLVDFFRLSKYRKTLDEMHKVLIKHRGNDHEVDGCPLLHYQARNEPPFRWLMLKLTGSNGNRTTLAIRQDNLYVVAFSNRDGRWFVFENEPFMDKQHSVSVLSFKSGYFHLVKGHKNLTRVQLGRERTQWAIDQLSCYRENGDGDIEVALATLIVTFCEPLRFVTILKKIEEGWMNGTTLNETESKLVVLWKTMSCALLRSKFEGKWGGHCAEDLEKKLGIKNRSTARKELRLMLWPEKCPINHHKSIPIKGLQHPCAEGAGEDEGVDDQAVKVVDTVDTSRLQEQPPFNKKQFVTFMKRYITAKYLKDLQFFVGESMHDDGSLGCVRHLFCFTVELCW